MLIRKKELIDKFALKHADATDALQRWSNFVGEAKWKSHADIKADFPTADYVGRERYVFNIKGNNYRLVVVVVFTDEFLTVRFLETHSEYNKIDCKTI